MLGVLVNQCYLYFYESINMNLFCAVDETTENIWIYFYITFIKINNPINSTYITGKLSQVIAQYYSIRLSNVKH